MPLCGDCVNKRPGRRSTNDASAAETVCKDVKMFVAAMTAPAEVPEVQPAEGEQVVVDVETIATEEEAERVLPERSRRALRKEAVSRFSTSSVISPITLTATHEEEQN